jgi:hypothetical protein
MVTGTCLAIRGAAFEETLSSTLSSNLGSGTFSRLDPELTMIDTTMLINRHISFTTEQVPFGVPRGKVTTCPFRTPGKIQDFAFYA